jgi:hypothetical protein
MIRWGLILAAVIIVAGAWFDWTYHAVRMELGELKSSIPSQDDLNRDDTGERLKAAKAACERLDSVQSSVIAKLFKGEQVKALAERCDEIKSYEGS